jgi:hypothetical protein
MQSPLLNGYKYIIAYESRQSGSIRSVMIPLDFIQRNIQGMITPFLQQRPGLREPWFNLRAESVSSQEQAAVNNSSGQLLEAKIPPYDRPELYKKCIIPHPGSKHVSISLEIHDLNELLYSIRLPIDTMFLPLVDKAAKDLFGTEVHEGNIIYYKVSLVKQDSQIIVTKSNKNVLIAADQVEVMTDVFEVPKLEKSRTRISFNKVREDSLPVYKPDTFGNIQVKGRGKMAKNRIVMDLNIYDELVTQLKLSATEENGGYLIGNVYRDPESPADEEHPDFKWLVEVTQVVPAEGTFGNQLLLLFTSETWSRVNQRIDKEFPNQKLIGWYHTHLFAGSDSFGLSELDQVLHRQFFTKPWQVALLLNIENNVRELRSFQKNLQLQKLEETQYEVFTNQNNEKQTVV